MKLEEIAVSSTGIETCLDQIMRELYRLGSARDAERDIMPLTWYINTGRASSDFLRRLLAAKPFMVARRLHKGGTYEETINRVCHLIGHERNQGM